MNLFDNTQKHTQELEALIASADRAITEENFSYLMDFYSENGSLVVKDGTSFNTVRDATYVFKLTDGK